MKFTLLIMLSSLLLHGCASTQQLKQGDVVENDYFSIAWNTATWDFSISEEGWYVLMEPGAFSDGKGKESQSINISIHKKITFNKSKFWKRFAGIRLSSMSYQKEAEYLLVDGTGFFFNKDANYEMVSRKDSGVPKLMALGYYKRAYNRKWDKVTYLQGLRCLDSVYLRTSFKPSKFYNVYCGYNDKDKGERIFKISYSYRSPIFDEKKVPWGEIKKTGKVLRTQPIEGLLKQAVKQIVSTLHIKNIDTERMKEEGLLHVKKPFEISEF